MEYKYPLFYPYMSQGIKNAVLETLGTRWLGQGPRVDAFERAIESKFNRQFAVSTNSGTSALELAYHCLDLKPGDEVLTTVLTCTATNIPLLRRGVKLTFVDINPKTLNMDLTDCIRKLSDSTKAIVAVNLGGIQHEIKNMGVPIITDGAQSIGLINGDYVIYSFQAIKHFTTGDGGVLFTPDYDTSHRAKLLRWFGIDREKKRSYDWQAYKEREMTFDIEEPGYKYQMTDIAASMGIAGLADYDKIVGHRRILFDRYVRQLKAVPGVTVVSDLVNTYWLCTVLVEKRDDFAKKLQENGIETNLVQLRNDIFKIFGGKRLDLPNMNAIENKYLSLPLHTNMNIADVDFICSVIKEGW